MLTTKRHEIILALLKKRKTASIHELSEHTGASISTIRRDLEKLEQEEKLKRVHGGASQITNNRYEPELEEKQGLNEPAKAEIGKAAAELIEEGDCLFIDAGTTTQQILPHLEDKNVVVVTNAYHFVTTLLGLGVEVYLTGGRAKAKTGALIGVQAEETLQSFRFDKSFIGMNGIHAKHGYTTPDPEEARVKRLAMDLSKRAFVLMDDSKFQQVSFSKVGDIRDAEIITNREEDSILSEIQKTTRVKVVKI
ncbi:DeoR/GlpR family DNA-binding transcription regulator [Pseudalkalibacillus salsuginis]|uniref:DeoR/GlpR family DNA-binding transcription regulator n=1 Tax=Pseudalkalibacillus salsuginis TaxID=2910972 RepID=UPI001F38F1D5|nr:DeoR/GlpR family DNA-binding transcription regulator [Pseudalkalibacillus salsuginis]MCF6409336.1 DeoR/GlpR family DNA-binding transcription regulator [Pseudalkalibacillus salsuginis]